MTSNTIGIGALSKATGIPVETLRTWERRYGFPNPERNDAGHRVYQLGIVEHLRLIDEALGQGHRPSNVVGMARAEIEQLLGVTSTEEEEHEDLVSDSENEAVRAWLEATIDLDGERLESALRHDWHQLGALNFLNERVEPFLFELGTAWAERRLDVAHEHFASERLRDFLTSHWRPLSDRSRGPAIICATLPGESHCLGLQMAAMVLAIAGCHVIYLGADTPVDDIARSADANDTLAVVISVSVAANRFMARRDLANLREGLADDIELVVGGLGAPDGVPDVNSIGELAGLHRWAKDIARGTQGTRH